MIFAETPLLSMTLDGSRQYQPGANLSGEFQIDLVNRDDIRAVELSVLWQTEGKGDTDLGVHFFQRWDWHQSVPQPDLWQKFATTLPASPLSYEGYLLKIRWCVRLRVILKSRHEFVEEQPFTLGHVPRPSALDLPTTNARATAESNQQ
jgi:hypothetical protein